MEKQEELLILGDEVRERIMAGVEKTIAAVGTTLGPKGQNVLIDSGHPYGPSTITKDGVTVLRSLRLPDLIENLAVKSIREASEKTVDECGDGTTTTSIIAGSIYANGLKHIVAGMNPVHMKRGIDKLTTALIKQIDSIKEEVAVDSQIRDIATISANGDTDIGGLIVDAIDKVGKKGVVKVENGKSMENELEIQDGLRIDRGYASPYFVNNPQNNSVELKNPLILMVNGVIQGGNDIIPILEKARMTNRPLLVIAEQFGPEALQTLVINTVKGSIQCAAIESPGFGERKREYLEDLAVLAGGVVITEELEIDLKQLTVDFLGSADSIVITKHETVISGTKTDKEKLEKRIETIESVLSDIDNDYDAGYYKERIAKLTGGIAVIRVGGASETEVSEKKDRIDDALGATRAAIEDGIVSGGGCALLQAAQTLHLEDIDIINDDEAMGVQILLESIKQPLKHIAVNAGFNGDVVANNVIENRDNETHFGFDAVNGIYGNMIDCGIIDPAKVTKSALKNAVSVATLLMTSKTIIMRPNPQH